MRHDIRANPQRIRVGQTPTQDFPESVSEHPPEASPFLHRRIDRAYTRMVAAKTQEWAHRWGDVYVTYVRARNAQRTPRDVAELEKRMGLR
jgi:hypothetical protein